jgi:hypothetical protein
MAAIYKFLSDYEPLIYIGLAIGGLLSFRFLWRAWSEWRRAVYSLEREFARRRLGQSVFLVVLVIALSCVELITASFIVPSLPASYFIPTPTLDLLATPTGTISAELATQIALTPRPMATLSGSSGCFANKLMITAPKAGTEIKGVVDVKGTVSIDNFGFYKFEFAQFNTDTWVTIAADRKEVQNDKLGEWNTTTLTPGDYQLRLVAVDNKGQTLPACVIPVRVTAP